MTSTSISPETVFETATFDADNPLKLREDKIARKIFSVITNELTFFSKKYDKPFNHISPKEVTELVTLWADEEINHAELKDIIEKKFME